MTQTKFAYPEIPYVIERKMYDYMVELDQLLKHMCIAINKLEDKVE